VLSYKEAMLILSKNKDKMLPLYFIFKIKINASPPPPPLREGPAADKKK
jgi:hypothetical protein